MRAGSGTSPRMFLALGLGIAVHNGRRLFDTYIPDPNAKQLGRRVLFHPNAEIGYRLDEHHSVSVFFEHISNASTAAGTRAWTRSASASATGSEPVIPEVARATIRDPVPGYFTVFVALGSGSRANALGRDDRTLPFRPHGDQL